jgi:hypothetical protein
MIKLDEYGLENMIRKAESVLNAAITTRSVKDKNLMISQVLGMMNGLYYLLDYEDIEEEKE